MTPNRRVTWQATSVDGNSSHARRRRSIVAARGARRNWWPGPRCDRGHWHGGDSHLAAGQPGEAVM